MSGVVRMAMAIAVPGLLPLSAAAALSEVVSDAETSAIASIDESWTEFGSRYRYPTALTRLKTGMRCSQVAETLGRLPDRIEYSYSTGGAFQEWEYPGGTTLYFTYNHLDSWRLSTDEPRSSFAEKLKKVIVGMLTFLVM